MKLAIISDLHADVHALKDALAAIDRMQCDACIRGNHDRWAARGDQLVRDWDISQGAMRFVRDLPTSWRARIEGVRVVVWHARPGRDMAGIYPDIAEEEAAAMLETAACDVLVVGHTHLPFERRITGGRLIANPGALLRDAAHPTDAAMLFDPESGRFVPSPAPGGGTFGVLELPTGTFTIYRAADGAEATP